MPADLRWEWDDLAIAPRDGYGSREHYYDGLTQRWPLGSFNVPAMLVAADDDPIVPPYYSTHPRFP